MFLAVLAVVLYMLGTAQVLGGIIGLVVGILGLREIRRRVAVAATDGTWLPAGAVKIEQRKGLRILRLSGMALALGVLVLLVSSMVTVAGAL